MTAEATRPCACGGIMRDWGCGPKTGHGISFGEAAHRQPTWVIDFFCRPGCGVAIQFDVTSKQLYQIRQGLLDASTLTGARWAGFGANPADVGSAKLTRDA